MCKIKNENKESNWDKIWGEIESTITKTSLKKQKNENINDIILKIKNDWITNQENITEKQKIKTEEWIEKFKLVHSDKFDYSLSFFINSITKFKIICKKCGYIFESVPTEHIKYGCAKCSGNVTLTIYEFIERSKLIHYNKYNYDLVIYKNTHTLIKIFCNNCMMIFEQLPKNHLKGSNCTYCVRKNRAIMQSDTTEDFIRKSKLVHGNKYNHSLIKYINLKTNVILICNDCNLIFEQNPHNHINSKAGCPHCNSIGNVSEPKLYKKIQQEFPDCKIQKGKPQWLKTKKGKGSGQSLDIYLPEHNIAIEYQGKQHFGVVNQFGGIDGFISSQERDERKRKLCLENNCKLFYFTYKSKEVPKNYPHKVYTDEQELITEIKNHINEIKNIHNLS